MGTPIGLTLREEGHLDAPIDPVQSCMNSSYMLGSRSKEAFVMMRKTISMPDLMADWIAARIERGQFNNESEYFRDLVRRDQEEEERKAYLISRLESGTEQLANGAYSDLASDEEIDRVFDAE